MAVPPPEQLQCADLAEAGRRVAAWARWLQEREEVASREICVTPGYAPIVTALTKAGLSFKSLEVRQRDPGREEQGIRLGTRRRIKGLEFRAVALVLTGPGEADVLERFQNYVAVTRAREYLLVVRCG